MISDYFSHLDIGGSLKLLGRGKRHWGGHITCQNFKKIWGGVNFNLGDWNSPPEKAEDKHWWMIDVWIWWVGYLLSKYVSVSVRQNVSSISAVTANSGSSFRSSDVITINSLSLSTSNLQDLCSSALMVYLTCPHLASKVLAGRCAGSFHWNGKLWRPGGSERPSSISGSCFDDDDDVDLLVGFEETFLESK